MAFNIIDYSNLILCICVPVVDIVELRAFEYYVSITYRLKLRSSTHIPSSSKMMLNFLYLFVGWPVFHLKKERPCTSWLASVVRS